MSWVKNSLLFIIFAGNVFSCRSQKRESNLVLVNIGFVNRLGMANEIALINSFNPKVIAIDLLFSEKTEPYYDSLLESVLSECKNLVMVSIIKDFAIGKDRYDEFEEGCLPEFTKNAKTGFINNILEDDEFETLKRFSAVEMVKDNYEYHFAVQTVIEFDSLKALQFVKNNPKVIDVDYSYKNTLKVIEAEDLFDGKVARTEIEDKIVLLGYLKPSEIDLFFSPLNKKVKPYSPDVHGLEYHACIVSQILDSH
jgi:CHASE2 domain-containing sensor protein